MTKQVARPRALAKSARGTNVSQKITIVTHICPVMLKMREILRFDVSAKDAAWALSSILKRPQPSCLKLLNGTLKLNIEGQTVLLQSDFGDQVHAAIMDAGPKRAWYTRRREVVDVIVLSEQAAEHQRRVDEAVKRTLGR